MLHHSFQMKFDPLTQSAIKHTLHCLLGCSIGEILGMVISTAFGWASIASIIISVVLAFFFGYLLTIRSLYAKDVKGKAAVRTAVATDTVSIISMEAIDNLFILIVPGAISAGLLTGLFWWSLAASLAVAFVITVPVNRWFLGRAGGHHHH
ncbi:MAG TPA: DUF4396 domain-containing protein [Candidatus Saccharimonadales bacterium]|nr:DUF4396 domain-containing protein [Candidatus Saccharimonadales bacterium]